jgi:hypothetical protein
MLTAGNLDLQEGQRALLITDICVNINELCTFYLNFF